MQKLIAAALFGLLSVALAAEDETFTVEGKISDLFVVTGNDESLRVMLDKKPKLCGTIADEGYVSADDDNYQGFLQLLISAKANKSIVKLHSKKDSRNHCKLIAVRVGGK
jgi:hypothetical protein